MNKGCVLVYKGLGCSLDLQGEAALRASHVTELRTSPPIQSFRVSGFRV